MSHVALFPLLETHTVPGWPEVYDPTLWNIGALVLGIPLAISAVVALIVMGPEWFRRSQSAGTEIEQA
ncbi:hypothetical protein G7070_01330 [Propioniciclava coleopterorum]|uniref:Uncharacterized protein n=1 Tax=Propioniciclava coleopterorum TaxID=2714937 RepID=A0A6G7Y2Y4_9ACTN|nr:hypothetical protein [Propioniciclava coleopterorum]QIK71175.1 hypothetical protein G7070_01330 [Propioniciclava coleopterorum]